MILLERSVRIMRFFREIEVQRERIPSLFCWVYRRSLLIEFFRVFRKWGDLLRTPLRLRLGCIIQTIEEPRNISGRFSNIKMDSKIDSITTPK